jgi:thiamine biosynthesis lipoprotein
MKKCIAILLLLIILCSCNENVPAEIKFEGRAQGTMYRIKYYDPEARNLQNAIDSIFIVIDNSLSLFNENSLICRINRNETDTLDRHLAALINQAIIISKATDGYFDFTVGPLVEVWKKAKKNKILPDSSDIDNLMKFTGYQLVSIRDDRIFKKYPEVQIDLNAIAQGYTVDIIAWFLEERGIKNYIIELGGEVRAGGTKPDDKHWTVGIECPPFYDNMMGAEVYLIDVENKSLASSGTYRQFFITGGKQYPHIINPKTGYPVSSNLFSVTVLYSNCTLADAYATAFMAMGLDLSLKSIEKNTQINVFFIYADNTGKLLTESTFPKMID